jgi:predicted DNA-binding protein
MSQADDSGRLLAHTMKELFPPRVELEREQFALLEKLSGRSGQPVRELVRQALERYLEDVETLDQSLRDDALK